MAGNFVVNAVTRDVQGTGASRRLRHKNLIPGILYGGASEPTMITMKVNEIVKHLETEAFYSHILDIEVDGKSEQAVLKAIQRHPAKPQILHMDFMRIVAGQEIRMRVPLHFTGEEIGPGVKAGGIVDHNLTDVEIDVLPRNLPEYIEVDCSKLEMDESIHLADITLPEGVELVALAHGDNVTVAAVHMPRIIVEETDEDADETPAEVPASAQKATDEGEGDDKKKD